jgi:hypothetical protein
MAKKELARFCSDYLSRYPELKASMDAITDHQQFAKAMVGAGSVAGFAFTEDDILEVLEARSPPSQELTEEQLDEVAGGAPKDQPKIKYMEFKLKEVIITG